jgi:single-strand DNA-binding protein
VGNLTRDPEIRYVDGGGKAVTKFSLAINRKTKGADETMFIDIVAWDRLGEVCNQYLKKGDPALISGRLAIRKYDDKDGNKRTAVEVVASDMQMLGTKRDAAAPAPARSGAGGGYAPASGGRTEEEEDAFDDIPF